MKNKLGITFDGVKTATYADALTVTRPMSPREKHIIQNEVDKIYADFKQRVADGRKKDTAYIDSIAQGRVWTGKRAVTIGLVDRIGNIEDAVKAAASLAGLKNYALREFPEPRSPLDVLFGNFGRQYQMKIMREELGDEQYQLLMKIRKIREQTAIPMARMAFDAQIQ